LADLKPFQSALKPDGQIRLLLTPTHPVQPAVIVIAALQAGFEPEIWQIVDQDHTFTLSPIPPDKPPTVELATLAASVRQEAYDAAQGQLAQADQPPTETVLIWTCWQSLLYSGLLHQVMTSMPVDQILNWTTDQIQAALTAIRG
jgi:hypothetical protein